MKIAVIGAGPAGMFAAYWAAQNHQVTLFEKKKRPGRKLMITGSGQCNLTHQASPKEMLEHYGADQDRFLRNCLYAYPPEKLMEFFEQKGVEFLIREDRKVFPADLKAQSILDCLLQVLQKAKVEIKVDREVLSINPKEKGFIVNTTSASIEVDKVILTTGGMSYPKTGSAGQGYGFAKSLGHKILPPKPALVDAQIRDFYLSSCMGQSFQGLSISLWRDNKKIANLKGDLLITHKGLSGPAILNHSRFMQRGDTIQIDFTGLGDKAEANLLQKIKDQGKKHLANLLTQYGIPGKFIQALLKHLKIPEDQGGHDLSKEQRKALIKELTRPSFIISGTGGFEKAMATAGGISLKEVNPKTMESRLKEGLYFAGEILDIDGDTGGYNLQAAFSTAYAAGTHI